MFDRFVSERTGTQRKGLRATVSLSVVAHVAAGVALVTWSFWKIDKLLPRYVPVSFATTAPLPMPPPEPPPPPPVRDPVHTTNSTHREPAPPRWAPEPEFPSTGGEETKHGPGTTEGPTGGPGEGPDVGPPAPPPERPPSPPAPPRMSDAERRGLIHAYLEKTVQPRVLHHFAYPSDAQRNGLEGTVILRLKIDSHGQLLVASIVSCPEPVLCQAALASAGDAAPFPAPPSVLGDVVSVEVRFEYHLD